jgi:hypothetical protein
MSNPRVKASVLRAVSESYDEFVDVLEEDLEFIILRMEANPQFFCNQLEDKITAEIGDRLRLLGYIVTGGAMQGGHTDLIVSYDNPEWSWLAEAKWYESLEKLKEGYLQLSTRYRTANLDNCRAGILAYLRRSGAIDRLEEWKKTIIDFYNWPTLSLDPDRKSEIVTIAPCFKNKNAAFLSHHPHSSYQVRFPVRHRILRFHWVPDDKSARNSNTRTGKPRKTKTKN